MTVSAATKPNATTIGDTGINTTRTTRGDPVKYLLQLATALLGTMAWSAAYDAWAQDHIPFELSAKGSRLSQPAATDKSPDVFLPDEDGDTNSRPASRPIRQWFRTLSTKEIGSQPDCGSECGLSCESEKCVDGDGVGRGAIRNNHGCEDRLPIGMTFFSGVESWRNASDYFFAGNSGIVVGGNLGVPLPRLADYGIGAQLGTSFGAFDLNGPTTLEGSPSEVQQQMFVTVGLFRRATDDAPINLGFVYDWMINDGYGVFSTSPSMGQCRGQIGYNLNAHNEVGVWGALNGQRSEKFIAYNGATATYRAINQFNLFWHHNFESGADGWLWLGVPEKEFIGGEGRLGEFTIGATMNVPVTQRVALYASGEYMKPAVSASLAGAAENAYTIGFGLAFFPRGSSRNRNVAGDRWMPYLPLANNGNFLIDTDAVPLH